MFVILHLLAFDAVFLTRVSAFSLPFIDEWPGRTYFMKAVLRLLTVSIIIRHLFSSNKFIKYIK